MSAQTGRKHYLGNIVYYVGENNGASYSEYILVDGQQRITSILLLLCALRDRFEEEGQTSFVDSINRRYLKNDTSDNRFRVRLKQTAYDSGCFTSIIDKTPFQDKENKIIKNYKLFRELLIESCISTRDIYEAIPKLEIVDVNLQIENDLTSVQTVFEKINSTGRPLTPADLIRNFLLLATSSSEQENLYQRYWLPLERTVTNDNISRFARDYLVMNIFEDVPNSDIYARFKGHFIEANANHIDILRDMCEYSTYYAWLKFNSCPNEKLKKTIVLLNALKTDDLYPLYLYLLKKLYDTNIAELNKVLNLLADFMLRYRIVSPSGGGGALRSAIQQIIENLASNVIMPTYDAIYYELSNSPTPASRFPDDNEFKKVLMDSVNATYARALLVRIEERAYSNIPVDLSKVTIEHLMPQTPTAWWTQHLGGEENSNRVYDTYLNCIGNLAPISQGYNSKNSNKPWPEKVINLREVQFNLTKQVADKDSWQEADIVTRNQEIAQKACDLITGPLPRTRRYQSKTTSDEAVSGLYPLSDLTTPMNGAEIEYLLHKEEVFTISTWHNLLNKICELCYNENPARFQQIVDQNMIHKATAVRNYPMKDPVITQEPSKLVRALRIEGTNYYTEYSLSSHRVRVYSNQLATLFNKTDDFQISINFE